MAIEEQQNNVTLENGDCFDRDTGSYLGEVSLTVDSISPDKPSMPVAIEIYFNGYWYTFNPTSKRILEEGEKEQLEKDWTTENKLMDIVAEDL